MEQLEGFMWDLSLQLPAIRFGWKKLQITSPMDDNLQIAKSKISIQKLWDYYQLPGTPSRSCKSPFREDLHPSFSVSDDGQFWNDFGTGDHGDQIDFIAQAEQISNRKACLRILEITSSGTQSSRQRPQFRKRQKKSKTISTSDKRIHTSVIRKLRDGTSKELESLLHLRQFPEYGINGLKTLQKRGLLRFLDVDDTVYWCITDSTYKNLQVRRLDGKPCLIGDREVKAKTWPGVQASWAIGLDQVEGYESILILEGGPDLIAAAIFCTQELPDLSDKIGYLCITGASMHLPKETASKLKGKAITIIVHADRAGKRASRNWSKQLVTGHTTNLLTYRISTEINDPSINDLADFLSKGMQSSMGKIRLKRLISRNLIF